MVEWPQNDGLKSWSNDGSAMIHSSLSGGKLLVKWWLFMINMDSWLMVTFKVTIK